MNIISAALLVITVGDISKGKRNSITWHILNPPIIFGEDGVLYCNVSAIENNSSKAATWMKDFDVIFDHKASTNHSKYTQKQHSDGFSLIIKKIDKDDINHQYTCLYDFFSYSAFLGINKQDFKYIPNKAEIKANINKTSDTIIFADVMFEKVYPLPECFCLANKEKINTNVTVEEEEQTGFLYRIKLKLVCEILHSDCMESVEVLCTVGDDEIVINDETFVNCLDININLVVMFAGLTLCVIFILLLGKKRQLSRRRLNSCDEEGVVANLTRSDDGHGEECERIPLLDYNSGRSDKAWVTCPAQKGVTKMVQYAIRFDKAYIQILETNTRIHCVRLITTYQREVQSSYESDHQNTSSQTMDNSYHHAVPQNAATPIQIDTHTSAVNVMNCAIDVTCVTCVTCPAQTEKDVIKFINYAKRHDTIYMRILVTNERINHVRQLYSKTKVNVV